MSHDADDVRDESRARIQSLRHSVAEHTEHLTRQRRLADETAAQVEWLSAKLAEEVRCFQALYGTDVDLGTGA